MRETSTGSREIGAITVGPMGRTLRLLGLGLSLCLTTLSTTAAGLPRLAVDFPLPVDNYSYHDQQSPSLFAAHLFRISRHTEILSCDVECVAGVSFGSGTIGVGC